MLGLLLILRNMSKVLILGAKGMLGQALSAEFAAASWDVIGYDREDIDITISDQVEAVLDRVQPQVVINAVALNAVDKIEEDASVLVAAEEVNGRTPGVIATLCRARSIVFVHYSSDYVFAGDTEQGYAEDATVAPLNAYGKTKALGEASVTAAGGEYYIIRLSKLFGRAAASEGAKKSFVDTMLSLAAGGKTEFDVVDDENSCPTYAPDLAKLTRTIVETRPAAGVYHGANSGACTWYGWAKEVFALKKIDVTLRAVPASAYPRPAARPHSSALVSTKLPAQRSWQEALREYLA